MNNSSSHDKSENPPPGQGTRKERIDDLLARIEKDIGLLREHIGLLGECRCIDGLSAKQIEQSIARFNGLIVRLLTLRVSENPPSGQGTCKDHIDDLIAGIEKDIDLLGECRRIDELSANEIEQLATKYYGLQVRDHHLLVQIAKSEAAGEHQMIAYIEPKIIPGTVSNIELVDEV